MFERLRLLAIAHKVDIRIQDDGLISVISVDHDDEFRVQSEDELLNLLEILHYLKSVRV